MTSAPQSRRIEKILGGRILGLSRYRGLYPSLFKVSGRWLLEIRVSALVAMFHDVIITLGVLLLGNITISTLAAILTDWAIPS
jgi:hypothetical protein